jgi:hypothetical protein
MSHATLRNYLHTTFAGVEDAAIEKLRGSRVTYDNIIERRIIFIPENGHHEPEHQIHNRGIANVRIDGDWDTLEVDIGNWQFDKIHRVSGTTVFDIFENGSCVPFLKFHRIQFMCKGYKHCILSYDIVSLNTPEKCEFVYKSQQFTGKMDTNMTIQSIPLSFNHPIENLIVHCEYPVSDINFFYSRHGPSLPFTQKSDSLWELDFGRKVVNFSQIDSPSLEVSTPTINAIRVFATGFQIAQIMYGMMRIVWNYGCI